LNGLRALCPVHALLRSLMPNFSFSGIMAQALELLITTLADRIATFCCTYKGKHRYETFMICSVRWPGDTPVRCPLRITTYLILTSCDWDLFRIRIDHGFQFLRPTSTVTVPSRWYYGGVFVPSCYFCRVQQGWPDLGENMSCCTVQDDCSPHVVSRSDSSL
jgi:hypothetical protein